MKAQPENDVENGGDVCITGDVIGDTAYSERFVLKILLKLANRDTLKEELKEQTFEEDLCTLWDMTAEREVVLYLQRHDTLNLFYFALPVIESSRIVEVIVGTIANMCCHKEAVDSFMSNKDLLQLLLEFLKSDDSQILNQLLRLISSCLYVAEEQDIQTWMDMFEAVEYPQCIYFILMNSTNKELLMTALENLNTICSNCKIEGSDKFSLLFETHNAIAAVYTAHREYVSQANQEENLERLHLITLQMMLHLDKTEIITNEHSGPVESRMNAINLLKDILTSYESKVNEWYKIDEDFLNVLEATAVFVQYFETSESCSLDKYFNPCYNMWKVVLPNEEQRKTERIGFLDEIQKTLALIMCVYMSKCTDTHLLEILDKIGDDYESIVSQINDAELQAKVANRALTRLQHCMRLEELDGESR